jgi:hypothetical protein
MNFARAMAQFYRAERNRCEMTIAEIVAAFDEHPPVLPLSPFEGAVIDALTKHYDPSAPQ